MPATPSAPSAPPSVPLFVPPIAAVPKVPAPAGEGRPDTTRFVLVEPSHAGNVGAAARAMRVMGFARLVLVRPRRGGLAHMPEAVAMASGAVDVLRAAEEVGTLAEALGGTTYACATAMTPRNFGPPTHAPRALLPGVAAAGHDVAFVFGPERTGLANDDVYRCHACLTIPAAPDYGSLNLGQAVQVIAYEWRQALGGFAVTPRAAAPQRADGAAVQGLLAHWSEVLVAIGFLDPAEPKKLMPRLNQLANRAQFTDEEVHILRGVARAVVAAQEGHPGHWAQRGPRTPEATQALQGPGESSAGQGRPMPPPGDRQG